MALWLAIGPAGPRRVPRDADPQWDGRDALNRWCEGNLFDEDHAHGVRQLVTARDLLAPIE